MKYTISITDIDEAEIPIVLTKLAIQGHVTKTPAVPTPAGTSTLEVSSVPSIPSHFTGENEVEDVIIPNVSATIQGVELDATGIPWDERIHTSTKKKTAKDFWKRKPRIEDDVFDAIVAELQAATPVVEVAAPAPVIPVPPMPTAPVEAPVAAVVPPVVPVAAPVAAPAPVTPPVTPVPAAITRDYSGLMQQISNLFGAKSIEPDYPQTVVDRVNTGFGVALVNITDVSDPKMVEYAWQCLEVDGKGI